MWPSFVIPTKKHASRDKISFSEALAPKRRGRPAAHRFIVQKDDAFVNTIGPGGSFGELGLLYNCKRTATCTAQTPAKVRARVANVEHVATFSVCSCQRARLDDFSAGAVRRAARY